MAQQEIDYYSYLRQTKKFPNVWCSGCGIGIVMSALLRAVDRLCLPKDDVALVSGIGCTGRMPVYMDFNTLHTTHGRALAFATGLKIAKPHLKVIVIMGDGDGLAIGGNHYIHTARRNIDLTAIIVNNNIYGMTGGQASPTTPYDSRATTAPYGSIEPPMPVCELAIAAGATYVARSTVYHATELDKMIEQAISHKGFSLIEAVSYCHTTFGRYNRLGSPTDMLKRLKETALTQAAYDKLPPDQQDGKIVRGVLLNIQKPEYLEQYDMIIARAKAQVQAEQSAREASRAS